MLGECLGREHPAHLGQRAIPDVVGEVLERPQRHAVLVDGRTRLCRSEALESEASVHRASPVVIGVLIDAPSDAGLLENIRNRRPRERRVLVGVARNRPLVDGRVGDPAAHIVGLRIGVGAIDALGGQRGIEIRTTKECDAIGISPGGNRAMVGVANREGFGQSELKRNIFPLVVAHRIIILVLRPIAEPALVPCRLRVGEAVRCAGREHGIEFFWVEMKWRNFGAIGWGGGVGRAVGLGVELVPDRLAALQRYRKAVAKPAYAFHGAEIMVETTVFLHQHDDVFEVLDRVGINGGFNGEGVADAQGQRGKRGGGGACVGAHTQEFTTIDAHECVLLMVGRECGFVPCGLWCTANDWRQGSDHGGSGN